MTALHRPRDQTPESSVLFETANTGRDLTLYQKSLNAADLAKAHAIIPHLEVPEGGYVKDIGSGTGCVTEIVARHFSRSVVYGVDRSHELLDVSERERMLMRPVYGNACEQIFSVNFLHAAYSSTCFHEIFSFEGSEGVKRALEAVFEELRPGGVLVIRDMVIPSDSSPVYMFLPKDDGKPATNNSDAIDYERLSTFELFLQFHKDFRGGEAFSYSVEQVDGKDYLLLSPEWAYEFYMRKDYRRNYNNEIHEKYGPWTNEAAQSLLNELGFVAIEAHSETNQWIVENRLEGQIGLFRKNESNQMEALPFFPTHLTLVARKPGEPDTGVDSDPELSLFDARAALQEVQIDKREGVLRVGDKRFSIDAEVALQGTKRMVFYRSDEPDRVVKVPRVDGENAHNCFKAMLQTIERQNVLDEYGVPHLPVLDYDRDGPPYRYLEQKRLPENARCAADLILNGEITEGDVKQMAKIVNEFELKRQWQLDTNPYNWYRVQGANGENVMTYADGKVYIYDERWAFPRKGLLQWLIPELLPGKTEDVTERCAAIPGEALADNTESWLDLQSDPVKWWLKHLDPLVWPETLAS